TFGTGTAGGRKCSNGRGDYSTAIGTFATSSGASSIAMGGDNTGVNITSTNGQSHSFVYGDGSANTENDAANQFMVRASGGFTLYDDATTSPIAMIAGGTITVG